MSELKQIRDELNLSQTAMGALYGVKQGVYQRWESAPTSAAAKTALEKAKEIYRKKKGKAWVSIGGKPVEFLAVHEDSPEYERVTGVLPHHIEEAWLILHEAATKGGTDLMAAEDQRDVGEAIATIAQAVSQGSSQEGRLRLARTAERLLLTIGKIPR